MRLKTVFIRFYKSFNFDYLRKHHAQSKSDPWEMMDDMWYPYVRVPVDPQVTTVVGANESGKSQLLTAIEKGISGHGIEREDFCRYSQFFTVEEGKMKWPDFGFEWIALTAQEQHAVRAACGLPAATVVDSFLLFRTNRSGLTVYLQNDSGFVKYPVASGTDETLVANLPHVFRINADVALPDSVSIRRLANTAIGSEGKRVKTLSRARRFALLDAVTPAADHPEWFVNAQVFTQSSPQIFSAFSPISTLIADAQRTGTLDKATAQFNLARDLICKVAHIDKAALADLYEALREGKEGHAHGIIQKINDALATSLNFPHWWVQDRHFQLVVSPREFDLVFTIRDRTATEYSFDERSSGLKYFLSYYIQYLAHEFPTQSYEILLMDEPDAYLSSQAQQDLLKIFDAFAVPKDTRRPVQVIYVTHSPFLIDKNHAERLRVLEKGSEDEGTRVVRDASRNHYEPLRSAFGAFVGETTFIGNCNIMVEGIADQVLLAGAATYLRARGASSLETLDLNHVTIVPAGSASHIPYLVYLARGRDIEQPAVVVLLDSDTAGNTAKKELQRGGARRKELLKPEFILQIGDLKQEVVAADGSTAQHAMQIEDLIPIALCGAASRLYLKEVCGAADATCSALNDALISAKREFTGSMFDAITAAVQELPEGDFHIEKIGFARAVIQIVNESKTKAGSLPSLLERAVHDFDSNMKRLFERLTRMQRAAERELIAERVSQRVDRAIKSFLRDHSSAARRDQALVVLEDIEESLDHSAESDAMRISLQQLRREFKLDDDRAQLVERYPMFREQLAQIKYAGRLATQETANEALEERTAPLPAKTPVSPDGSVATAV